MKPLRGRSSRLVPGVNERPDLNRPGSSRKHARGIRALAAALAGIGIALISVIATGATADQGPDYCSSPIDSDGAVATLLVWPLPLVLPALAMLASRASRPLMKPAAVAGFVALVAVGLTSTAIGEYPSLQPLDDALYYSGPRWAPGPCGEHVTLAEVVYKIVFGGGVSFAVLTAWEPIESRWFSD